MLMQNVLDRAERRSQSYGSGLAGSDSHSMPAAFASTEMLANRDQVQQAGSCAV